MTSFKHLPPLAKKIETMMSQLHHVTGVMASHHRDFSMFYHVSNNLMEWASPGVVEMWLKRDPRAIGAIRRGLTRLNRRKRNKLWL